jgi:cysteine desulfurase
MNWKRYIEAVTIFATVMELMPSQERIYLDHAATTPVIAAAREAMAEAMSRWANPSSPHQEGRAARAALEDARARVANALGWDGDVIFTSGASEAIAIALRGYDAVASSVEHDAVLAVAGTNRLSVDSSGYVDLSTMHRPARYAVQSVNSETGVSQPIESIADHIFGHESTLFADCSQSAGKQALPSFADLIAVSAHKLGGPPGIGALLVRDLALIKPCGGQEQGYRRGTENLPAAVGFAVALEAGFDWVTDSLKLRTMLDSEIEASGGEVVARNAHRFPTIASYRMPGMAASSQLINFDMAGIAVSAGSACSSGTLKTSHVLRAMEWDERSASEVIRVSFGRDTNESEVNRFIDVWRSINARAKAA